MSLLEDEKKAEERAKSIHNEQAKLTATYLNGLAIALLAIGGFTPIFSGRLVGADRPTFFASLGAMLICLGISPILHLRARALLRSLR